MTITIEKPSLDADETELSAEATIEAFTDLLKASAPPAPEVAPAPTVTAPKCAITISGMRTQLDPAIEYVPSPYSVTYTTPVMLPMDAPLALASAICACEMCVPAEGLVTDVEVAHALQLAASYLERHGWAQGNFYIGQRACAVGAIMVGVGGQHSALRFARTAHLAHLARQAVVRWLTGGDPTIAFGGLEHWNDMPGRKAEEVIGALRGAAGWLLERSAR